MFFLSSRSRFQVQLYPLFAQAPGLRFEGILWLVLRVRDRDFKEALLLIVQAPRFQRNSNLSGLQALIEGFDQVLLRTLSLRA